MNLLKMLAALFSVIVIFCVGTRLALAAPQYTQSANQCIQSRDYPVGYNNSAYNFRRFYNTCNARLNVYVVGSNGATDFGILLEGGFLVMSNTAYSGAPLLPTEVFACVAPGMPSNGFGSYPAFGANDFYCVR